MSSDISITLPYIVCWKLEDIFLLKTDINIVRLEPSLVLSAGDVHVVRDDGGGGILWYTVVYCGIVWCGVVWCSVVCSDSRDLIDPQHYSGPAPSLQLQSYSSNWYLGLY